MRTDESKSHRASTQIRTDEDYRRRFLERAGFAYGIERESECASISKESYLFGLVYGREKVREVVRD
jgi:hypothetical protein